MKHKSNEFLKSKENFIKTKYPVLNALWIGLLIDVLGFYIIIPYIPSLIDIFNATPVIIGLLLATNAAFSLFSAPIWGKLSDKYGRRPIPLIAEAGTCSAFLILSYKSI